MNLFLKGCLAAGVALTTIGSMMTAFDYARTLRRANTPVTEADIPSERGQEQQPQAPQILAEASTEALDNRQNVFSSAKGPLLSQQELSGLRDIEIELSGGSLQVSTGDAPGLWVGEKLLPHLQYAREGDTLTVKDTLDRKWWKEIHSREPAYTVRLVLPRQEQAEIALTCGIGEASIAGLAAENLLINAGAGDVHLTDLSAGELTLSCGAGQLTANGMYTTKKAEIDCGIGELALSGDLRGEVAVKGGIGEVKLRLSASEEEYSITAEAGIGEVKIGGRSVSMLSGSFSRQREDAENSLDISCGIGEIDIRFSEDNDKSF